MWTDPQEPFVVEQPLRRYHRLLSRTAQLLEAARPSRGMAGAAHTPAYALPDPDDEQWETFFGGTPLRYHRVGGYRGCTLDCIDLMGNPGTMTTKSLASETLVARAILHARQFGQRLTIVTPTSGNKGTALRDAVARAQSSGIRGADLVRSVMVVPSASLPKLRRCVGDADPAFTARNPVVVANVATGAELKEMVAKMTERANAGAGGDTLYWYTLALDNYRLADTTRAFLEHDAVIAAGGGPPAGQRLHAHTVSSAFGLLGYQLGRDLLQQDPQSRADLLPPAAFLLIQHLGAPDMVLHQLGPGAAVPAYAPSPDGDWFVQRSHPRFPYETDHPDEIIDPTFYTRQPPTAPAMTELIRRQGGGGVVVSRRECLNRFAEIRDLFGSRLPFPPQPGALREWSLLMAACGILNAVDRGLVEGRHIVLHATGCYWDDLLPPLPADHRTWLGIPDELITVLRETACRN